MAFLARPLLFALSPERAHGMALAALGRWGRAGAPGGGVARDRVLATRVAGIDFANPVGLAAGLDKNGVAIDGFFGLGFGSVEIGTLTPLPQPGNPQPRLFRVAERHAIINRMGFNNGGLDAGLARARAAKRAGPSASLRTGVLGINVGANKDAADRIADYAKGVRAAAPVADYLTINISSPNTPGLRDLQHGAALAELLAACTEARAGARTPIFLKVAPDLDASDIDGIARAAIEGGVDALVVSNTTVQRPADLEPRWAREAGGLSGAPLASLARQRLADFRAATAGGLPLISAGGIDSAEEAYARIRTGASLVQLYTALIYQGPGLPRRIARGLARLLGRDGFASVAEAVGTGASLS